jgi:hypothetical protein
MGQTLRNACTAMMVTRARCHSADVTKDVSLRRCLYPCPAPPPHVERDRVRDECMSSVQLNCGRAKAWPYLKVLRHEQVVGRRVDQNRLPRIVLLHHLFPQRPCRSRVPGGVPVRAFTRVERKGAGVRPCMETA